MLTPESSALIVSSQEAMHETTDGFFSIHEALELSPCSELLRLPPLVAVVECAGRVAF